jgi:hypothetical protein
MKPVAFFSILICVISSVAFAQGGKKVYPEPEFSKEIYLLHKDSVYTVSRLEKGSSKLESNMKMGGMGGGDNSYVLEGSRSNVRVGAGQDLSFVYYVGSSSNRDISPEEDSAIRASGVDPSMANMGGSMSDMMNDPSQTTALYNAQVEKGKRKIVLQSYGGMGLGLGKKKGKETTKFTLSIKKIRDGYYELVVDKPLPRGEYAFVISSYGGMDGSQVLFAFGVD